MPTSHHCEVGMHEKLIKTNTKKSKFPLREKHRLLDTKLIQILFPNTI